MAGRRRFDAEALDALARGKILRIRAGEEHRFIGIWMVVVERRLFVRSWDRRPGGWFDAFAASPRGAIQIGGREIPVRAVRSRSERIRTAVDRAYAAKYRTGGSLEYVRGFRVPSRRSTTTELVPL